MKKNNLILCRAGEKARVISRIINFRNIFLSRVCDRNIVRASSWLLLYSSLPTAVLGALIIFAISHYSPELFRTVGTAAGQKNIGWFASLIFNPLFESLMIAAFIKISVKLKAKQASILISAVLVSSIHSLQSPLWGVTVLCFFLIQSYAFFHAFRADFRRSYLVISIAHSLHNAWIIIAIRCLGDMVESGR